MTVVLSWIVWCVLLGFACGWSYGLYLGWRGRNVRAPVAAATLTWWFLLAYTLFVPEFNKLHLLWLAPIPVVLAPILTFVFLRLHFEIGLPANSVLLYFAIMAFAEVLLIRLIGH